MLRKKQQQPGKFLLLIERYCNLPPYRPKVRADNVRARNNVSAPAAVQCPEISVVMREMGSVPNDNVLIDQRFAV